MVSESEKTPAVGLSESFAVFNHYVEAVVCPIKIAATGWLRLRSVRESRAKHASQLFSKHSSFRERARFQVTVQIPFLNIYLMKFGERRLSLVEAIGRQRDAHRDPSPIPSGKCEPSLGVKNGT